MILESEEMRELMLSVLGRAKSRYVFAMANFCVMGNHVHLLISPGKGESLSAIMRWVNSVFAMAFNRKTGQTGHVWGGRFFSRIVDGARDFLRTLGYMDWNPVRARMVDNPWDWGHGGLGHHRTGRRDLVDDVPAWARLLLPEHGLLAIPDSGRCG